MSAGVAARAPWREAWQPALLVIAACLAILLAVFQEEIAAAMGVWSESTAYGHCWLVLPIAGWLLWDRRDVAAAGTPCPSAWPALLVVPLAAFWFASDWLGIMEGRQLALVGFIELLLVVALGWRLWWALSAAFLYLIFLVPFGAFITPALQEFTYRFILGGLRLLDIPFTANALQIQIPEGVFYVAEACAGLRFLIASIAFGVLYAVTMFRSPWRRAAFIAVACVVPLLANGVRGLGIAVLGHLLGSAQAGAADHLIYGWVFFSSVIVLLAVVGFPFRQPPQPLGLGGLGGDPPRARRVLMACLPVVLLAVLLPALGQGRTVLAVLEPDRIAPILPTIQAPAGCVAGEVALSGATSRQSLRCGIATLLVTTRALAPDANPMRVLGVARDAALAGLGTDIDSGAWATPLGAPWMLMIARDTGRAAAYAVWADGVQRLGGLRDRLAMACWQCRGGPKLAVAVSVAAGSADAVAMLKAFLAAQTGLTPSIRAAVRGAR